MHSTYELIHHSLEKRPTVRTSSDFTSSGSPPVRRPAGDPIEHPGHFRGVAGILRGSEPLRILPEQLFGWNLRAEARVFEHMFLARKSS